jgi:hypothetical protein
VCALLSQVPPTPPAPAPAPSTSSADYFYVFKLPPDAPVMPDTMSVLKYLLSKQPTYPGGLLCMLLSKPKGSHIPPATQTLLATLLFELTRYIVPHSLGCRP